MRQRCASAALALPITVHTTLQGGAVRKRSRKIANLIALLLVKLQRSRAQYNKCLIMQIIFCNLSQEEVLVCCAMAYKYC